MKTIIVGMHEALPGSTSFNHAMDDATCSDICQAQRVYDRLDRAQQLEHKHVYVLASHSHFFRENIYATDAHKNHVLPGWIVGTAGAEQYQDTIRYGYLQVEVRPNGEVETKFMDISRNDPPLDNGKGGLELTKYCFEQNSVKPPEASQQQCPKCPAK